MTNPSDSLASLSFRSRLLFVLGYPGFAITSALVSSIGIYFYLPPAGAGLETQVSEEVFLGVLTAYGLARLIGGVVDSSHENIDLNLHSLQTREYTEYILCKKRF